MKPLRGRVVVITGASSGLGRATALELARCGCALVLAARDPAALEDTAASCRELGAVAHAVPTDVTDPEAVQRLAGAALAVHGRIDVWINNAAITFYALLEEASAAEHEQVIRTNLMGSLHGARAAVPIFREQHEGVMINIGSVLSTIGHAYVPSYVISKFGVHGLTEALRVELADEPAIHVCTIFPYAIDTPHFESAGNQLGRAPHALPPVQSPEAVARAIRGLVERPRRVRFVPRAVPIGLALHALLPRTTERLLLDALRTWQFGARAPATDGNLFRPTERGTRHGERAPVVGTWRFALWLAARFARLLAGSVLRPFAARRRLPRPADAAQVVAAG